MESGFLLRLVFLLGVLVESTTLNAQIYEWAKEIGGIGYDEGKGIALDGNGNVYTIGWFADTVDFDPGIGTYELIDTSNNWVNTFISKLDANGNFVWVKQINAFGTSIVLDDNGNIYTTGYFTGIVDFDPGVGVYNLGSSNIFNGSIFIAKFDSLGNFVWAKSTGGAGYGSGLSIAVDNNYNVYTTGYFQGTIDFDPAIGTYNLTSSNLEDIFVYKLDAMGNFTWAKNMGGVFNGGGAANRGYSISVDNSGNVYTSGEFCDTVDFDPGFGVYNLMVSEGHGFISKLDPGGNFVWAKNIGGIINASDIDNNGNIYLTGCFTSTRDFDPGVGIYNLTSAGFLDIFISKLDANGNFVWAKGMEGVGTRDEGSSIVVDNNGNVYTTGEFQDTVDFDPGVGLYNLNSLGDFDIFISKLDANGNFVWAKQIGGGTGGLVGNIQNIGKGITLDNSGNVYTTGYFAGISDFDPPNSATLNCSGIFDIFIAKYSQCHATSSQIMTACNSYVWNGNTYTTSGIYSFDTTNIAGCDSTATLVLTIDDNNSSNTIQSACDSYTWNGNTYTASGTYTFTTNNSAGCDSTATLNLTINTVNTGVSQSTNTLTANATGASYQWLDCNNNYAALSGETGQSFTANINGSYAVAVSLNGCIDTSACFDITGVGIVSNTFGEGFSLYPNPTEGKISIELGGAFAVTDVAVFNVLGQEVIRKEFLNEKALYVNIEGESGVYLVYLRSGEKEAVVRVVKE